MTLCRALLALALLFAAVAWAGGDIVGNPATLRPHLPGITQVTRPAGRRSLSDAPHAVRRAARRSAPVRVLALRGVAVNGDVFDLSVPVGLRLSDPLPVPREGIADLEIDLEDGSTVVVPVEDPDAAAEAGAVILEGVEELPVAGWVAVVGAE